MIDKKFVKKILRGALEHNRSLDNHNLMHPEREWSVGLIIATLILGSGVYWCLHLYSTYSEVEVVADSNKINDQSIYQSQEIEDSLKEFSARQEKYNGLRKELETSRPSTPFVVPIEDSFLEEDRATGTNPDGFDHLNSLTPISEEEGQTNSSTTNTQLLNFDN